jgi:hypothetical protein
MSSLLYFFQKYYRIQPELNFNRYKNPLKSKVLFLLFKLFFMFGIARLQGQSDKS